MSFRSLRFAALPFFALLSPFALASLGCGDTVDVGANRPDNLGASGNGGKGGSAGAAGKSGCEAGIEPAFCLPKCQTSDDCGAGKLCDKSSATSCGAEGVCVAKPEFCTEECADPGFCGCDGKIHCTGCQANSAGVSLSPDPSFCQGAPQPTGCTNNTQCAANTFCDFGASSACGVAGTCQPKAQACDASCASPMLCGCDGNTYCSACVAGEQGVSIDPTAAACQGGQPGKEFCGGDLGTACGDGRFCDFSGATACGAKGVCKDKPQGCVAACDGPGASRCGCDGQLRCSVCDLNAAGVSLSPDPSICPAPSFKACGDTGLPACAADEFCDFAQSPAPGTCPNRGVVGVCAKRPVNCTEECASPKLCGCDGKLYCNACSAEGAGTSISSDSSICSGAQTGNYLITGDAACPAVAPTGPSCSVDGAKCSYQGMKYGLDESSARFDCRCNGNAWACLAVAADGSSTCPRVTTAGRTSPSGVDACPVDNATCTYAFVGSPSFGACTCGTGAGGASPDGPNNWLCGL